MRTHRAFRPWLSEVLEPRAVPSTSGVATPTGVLGITVTLPAQVSPSNPRVQAAFAAFDRSYIRAVDTILLAPGADGLVVPLRNREAFDASVERSLEALAGQLILSLNPATTPADSAAASQVVSAIVGDGANSLESQLLALPTTAIGLQVPGASTTANGPAAALVPIVVDAAEQVRPTNRVPVAEAAGPSTTPANPTSMSTSPSKASGDVRSAFNNFLNDYFKAVQGVLLAPVDGGRVDPPARRADFDARVDQALRSLGTRLSSTLTLDPATSTLGPRVVSTIEGAGAGSLKSRLASLATPDASEAAVVRDFTLGSTRAIAQALSMIAGDVAKLLGPAGR